MPKLVDSWVATWNPKDLGYTGQEKDQYLLNITLYLMKTTYKTMMEQSLFPEHCLRGRRRLEKSSNTPKIMLKIPKRLRTSMTMPIYLKKRHWMMTRCHVTILPCFTPVFYHSDQSRPLLLSSANS